jgi:hypothetical protein
MKKIITILAVVLTGCATPQWNPPITKADQFDCEQKCGFYNRTVGIIESAICVNKCYEAKGYKIK